MITLQHPLGLTQDYPLRTEEDRIAFREAIKQDAKLADDIIRVVVSVSAVCAVFLSIVLPFLIFKLITA